MSEKILSLKAEPIRIKWSMLGSRLAQKWVTLLCFIVFDLFSLFFVFDLAIWFRSTAHAVMPQWFPPYYPHSFLIGPIAMLFAFWFLREQLYSFHWGTIEEFKRLAMACSMSMLCFLAFLQLSKMLPSRGVLLTAWFLSLVVFPAFRLIARYFLAVCRVRVKSVLVFSNSLLTNEQLPFNKPASGYEYLGVFSSIVKIRQKILKLRPTEVVIFTEGIERQPLDALIGFARRHVSSVKLVGDELCFGHMRTYLAHDFSALEVRDEIHSILRGVVKRCMDLIGSIMAIILLLPVYLIITILIILDSPGPVFFTQKRVGKGGILFRMFKFRSMYLDSEDRLHSLLNANPKLKTEYAEFKKLKDDPRITKVGKWLRKYSLDELSQFFNVLKGDMSLVGPRPYLLKELKGIPSLRQYIQSILRVTPGVTGYQQVYHRGVPFADRVKIDHYAVKHWSLWMDIAVLFRTIWVVLSGKGAH